MCIKESSERAGQTGRDMANRVLMLSNNIFSDPSPKNSFSKFETSNLAKKKKGPSLSINQVYCLYGFYHMKKYC